MTTFQQRDMTGAMFKNDKGDNAKRPDYRGDLAVNGVNYEIAGWIKDGAKGKFFSLSVKPKEARPVAPAPSRAPALAPRASAGFDDFDDSIPF